MGGAALAMSLVVAATSLTSCALECGEGTVERDGECVLSAEGTGGSGGTGTGDSCLPVAAPASLETEADVRAYLGGRWVLCSGAMMPEGAGIELEDDGSWHFLQQDGSGELVSDPTSAGIGYLVTETMPRSWVVTFFIGEGGEYIAPVGFYPGNPPRLSLTFHGWDVNVQGWYRKE